MILKILLIFLFSQAYSQEKVDFSGIKDLIEKDKLNDSLQKIRQKEKKRRANKVQRDRARYNIPGDRKFWSFMSEMWLVKNAQILKWDFPKPEYGIETAFKELMTVLGYYEKKFKILIINTPTITHFALPSDPNEYIFVLSLPFIRTMDLTKTEISLLLFEDFMRLEFDQFKSFLKTKEVERILNSNFHKKKLDKKVFADLMKRYDHFIFEKGFNFNQMFKVTQRVGDILKGNMVLWNSYLGVLRKQDNLLKSNDLYRNLTNIYPSPEMQIKWITPEPKKL